MKKKLKNIEENGYSMTSLEDNFVLFVIDVYLMFSVVQNMKQIANFSITI